jgi:hypothetical protein
MASTDRWSKWQRLWIEYDRKESRTDARFHFKNRDAAGHHDKGTEGEGK